MENVFVNLRECEGDTWTGTTTTDASGRYRFGAVAEGGYYVEFFKPHPRDEYSFTVPMAGGEDDDETTLDSDVVELLSWGDSGRSDCLEVREGFDRLTNAGFVRAAQKDDET